MKRAGILAIAFPFGRSWFSNERAQRAVPDGLPEPRHALLIHYPIGLVGAISMRLLKDRPAPRSQAP
jgi:hypothetical protein